MASKELFLLLRVLDERNTSLGRDDIAWAFEPPKKSETETWVREYISPHTLLSREEHTFYQHLGQTLPKHDGSNTGCPLSNEELELAITSLESSTAAIEEQCKLMETQKQALQALKARNSGLEAEDDETTSEKQARKVARDKAQLDLELEEVSAFLQSRLRSSLKQTEGAVANLPMTVQRLLEKDDRLLDGLQKVLPKLEGTDESSAILSEVDKLTHTFTLLEAKAIRAQTNATYLHHCPTSPSQSNDPDSQQNEALCAELEELSSEIDGLVALVAENTYRHPITRGLQTSRASTIARSAQWSQYLASTLTYLTRRLEALDEHFAHVHAHRLALGDASLALEETLAEPKNPAEGGGKGTGAKTPQKGLKLLRLVQENKPEVGDPVAGMLQHLGVRAQDLADVEKLASLLERTREERQGKLEAVEKSTEEAMGRQLVESLSGADGDLRELLGAVYAYTEFSSKKLVDRNVQARVDGLEDRTRELGERMRGLDLEGLGVEVRRVGRKLVSQGER